MSAEGYYDYSYTLNFPTGGTYMLQNITLMVPGNTITFSANGGSGTVASLRVPNGNSVTLPGGSGLSKSGHTFDGWNTNSAGTGDKYSAGASYTPDGDVTLYAMWIVRDAEAFTDSRDGKIYKKVKIGSQTWMAENLNYDFPGVTSDVCYNNSADSCAKYGRLYDWSTAMGGYPSSSADPSGVQGVCPVGWHLPSDAEWTALTTFVGTNAGTKLKSKTGWSNYGNGTDEFGFSALPGGYGNSGDFYNAGNGDSWWSASETDAGNAWNRGMNYYNESVHRYHYDKTYLFAVRCVQD